jgi:hypothetical protein
MKKLIVGIITFGFAMLFISWALFSQDVMAMCVDGTVDECVVNGKPGMRKCVGGHLTPCIPHEEGLPCASGTLLPMYNIITVVYAPPGTAGGKSASVVDYKDGSTTGSTVSSSDSFKSDTKVSATVTGGILGTATAGASFGVSRNTADSSKLDIKKSTSTSIKSPGPSVDGIDHNRDIIYLLLNPKIDLQICGKTANWGLGYSGQYADIQYVYVGWLKDPTLIPPGLASNLAAHGLTDADYKEILKADPFASGSSTIDPIRYLPTNTSFPYIPPFSPGESGPTFTYVQQNDLTATQSQSSQLAYSVGVSASGGVDFLSVYKATIKAEQAFTWTNSSETSHSSATSQSASVTVGSPSYGYEGSTDIAVYYDSLFKTFMFSPITDTNVAVEGKVQSKLKRAVTGREVFMYANGKKYRTFTNEHGHYRFMGKFAGPIQVEVTGVPKKVVPPSPKPKVDFILPDKNLIPVRPR